MSPHEVRAIAEAGGRFAVSPHTDAAVVAAARQAGLAAIPGAATPTEVVTAWRAGASCVKVFPTKTLGGPEYIKLLRGPLPDVPLLATGGIELGAVPALFAAGVDAVGATSDMFAADWLARGDFAAVTERARRWTEVVAGALAATAGGARHADRR